MCERGSSRSSFGPVVLLGLVSAGLAAVASAKPWLDTGSGDGSSDATMTAVDTGTRYPLASAISLVLLAAWGVLLVTRGRVRRVFAVLATLAAVALVVSVVVAYLTLPDAAMRAEQAENGLQRPGRAIHPRRDTRWQHTGKVRSDATAGHMRQRVHVDSVRPGQRQACGRVDPGRFKELLA